MDDREALIAAVRSVVERLGVRRLSLAAFRSATHIDTQKVYRNFESWYALCEAAGIRAEENNRRVREEEIFTAMQEVFLATGSICTQMDFVRQAAVSKSVRRHVGGGRACASSSSSARTLSATTTRPDAILSCAGSTIGRTAHSRCWPCARPSPRFPTGNGAVR